MRLMSESGKIDISFDQVCLGQKGIWEYCPILLLSLDWMGSSIDKLKDTIFCHNSWYGLL